MTREEERTILDIARRSIVHCVTGTVASADAPLPLEPTVDATGVFVTVRVQGRLRGCIGFVNIVEPFPLCLVQAAQRAATEDLRFESIRADELDAMTVDVTLLFPLERISGSDDIVLGTHGVHIDFRGRRGLLLPQVAIEQQWDAEAFLRGVCSKAGLPSDAWRDPGARVSRFRGIVVKEMEERSDAPPQRSA